MMVLCKGSSSSCLKLVAAAAVCMMLLLLCSCVVYALFNPEVLPFQMLWFLRHHWFGHISCPNAGIHDLYGSNVTQHEWVGWNELGASVRKELQQCAMLNLSFSDMFVEKKLIVHRKWSHNRFLMPYQNLGGAGFTGRGLFKQGTGLADVLQRYNGALQFAKRNKLTFVHTPLVGIGHSVGDTAECFFNLGAGVAHHREDIEESIAANELSFEKLAALDYRDVVKINHGVSEARDIVFELPDSYEHSRDYGETYFWFRQQFARARILDQEKKQQQKEEEEEEDMWIIHVQMRRGDKLYSEQHAASLLSNAWFAYHLKIMLQVLSSSSSSRTRPQRVRMSFFSSDPVLMDTDGREGGALLQEMEDFCAGELQGLLLCEARYASSTVFQVMEHASRADVVFCGGSGFDEIVSLFSDGVRVHLGLEPGAWTLGGKREVLCRRNATSSSNPSVNGTGNSGGGTGGRAVTQEGRYAAGFREKFAKLWRERQACKTLLAAHSRMRPLG